MYPIQVWCIHDFQCISLNTDFSKDTNNKVYNLDRFQDYWVLTDFENHYVENIRQVPFVEGKTSLSSRKSVFLNLLCNVQT